MEGPQTPAAMAPERTAAAGIAAPPHWWLRARPKEAIRTAKNTQPVKVPAYEFCTRRTEIIAPNLIRRLKAVRWTRPLTPLPEL
jgi:hypothetical protein